MSLDLLKQAIGRLSSRVNILIAGKPVQQWHSVLWFSSRRQLETTCLHWSVTATGQFGGALGDQSSTSTISSA
jgi:hypothetical protein